LEAKTQIIGTPYRWLALRKHLHNDDLSSLYAENNPTISIKAIDTRRYVQGVDVSKSSQKEQSTTSKAQDGSNKGRRLGRRSVVANKNSEMETSSDERWSFPRGS